MKKKKVQKLLSAAMMVSICVTLGAMPVSAASMSDELENMFVTEDATDSNENTTPSTVTSSGEVDDTDITWTYDEREKTLTFDCEAPTSGTTQNQSSEQEIPSYVTDKMKVTSGSAVTWENTVETLKIKGNIVSIAANAFEGWESLNKVTISNKVTKIGDEAFLNCKQLTTAELRSSLEEIGVQAFANCEKLTNVKLPTTLKTIGD